MLEPTLRVTNPTTLTDGHVIAASTVAAALDRLYSDRDLLRRRSLEAYRRATDPSCQWDAIAARFSALFVFLSERRGREATT